MESYILIFFFKFFYMVLWLISYLVLFIFFLFLNMFFVFCFYLLSLLFLYTLTKIQSNLRLMIKFPFQGYKIFIKSFYYINFFNSFHKTLHFFFFLRRCFINFFGFSMQFPLIKLFVYLLCLFSNNVIVCCDEDIGWSYLENNFEKIILNIVIFCKRILKIYFIFTFFSYCFYMH